MSKMQARDIAQAVDLWVEQYKRYCGGSRSFPRNWIKNTGAIEGYLSEKVEDGIAFALKSGDALFGYITYDEFPFHGEDAAFCPPLAHAAVEEYKEAAYLALYRRVSKIWVDKNILSHMFIIFYHDARLRCLLYDLGFGSYLVDAFACANDRMGVHSAYTIRRAEPQDAEALCGLVEESREFYRKAPIFLARESFSQEDILNILQKNTVYMAWEAHGAIGFLQMGVSHGDNTIELSEKGGGHMDGIGVYIQAEYRGKGVGRELLGHAMDDCIGRGIERIHVDFETANPFANKFWKKYFDPMLLSVRRTIPKDINHSMEAMPGGQAFTTK